MAGFYAKTKPEVDAIVEQGKVISDLGNRLDDRVKTYSKGMLRRLLLARALMMKPKLAILDEPTSGLDVVQSINVRNMIKKYTDQEGVTVLLSSHNMLEVEYLCHRVALINQGIVVTQGTPEELKQEYNKQNLEEVFMEVTHVE